MEHKPIYVDGVDVSKCKHFKNRTCIADYLLTDMDFSEAKCELCKDCYYKQLARKTQECNKLYIQLKADEEYHKKEENTLRKIIKNKEERNIELYKENNKLKKTLAEIKEIVRQEIVCDDCNFQGTDKCDSRLCTSFYLDDFCKSLLQKISECEVK